MSSVPSASEIAADATWLPQALDPAAGLVRLVRMDREAYRAASFLDDRMFQQQMQSAVITWAAVEEASGLVTRHDARWIFHIGHVGSTLIACLLGELDGVLSIREPRPMRDLTVLSGQELADKARVAGKLFSRTFGPAELAVVKATSFVSEIAPLLVPPGSRVLLVYAAPRAYIESILAGPNSRVEMGHLAASRAARSATRVHGFGAPANEAELAAAAWACEMTSLEAAAEAFQDSSVEWIDFDRFLDAPGQGLGHLAAFFGFEASADQLHRIATGPLMGRYSKALEYEYSPSLRRELLSEARRDHGPAIDRAFDKLTAAASRSPLLKRALDQSETEL